MKFKFLKLGLLWLVIIAALGAVVMLLWNWLIPAIFGLGTINFLQALGLFVLARLLFGGFGFGRRNRMSHHMGRMGDNPVHEKWKNMTPEERKQFIEKRRRFGFGRPFGDDRFDMGSEDHKKENE